MSNKALKTFFIILIIAVVVTLLFFIISKKNDNGTKNVPKKDADVKIVGEDIYGRQVIEVDGEKSFFVE